MYIIYYNMTFQKKVIGVIAVGLVIYLAIVFLMYSKGTDTNWPPLVAACPDYWTVRGTENGEQKCINMRDLGTCPPTGGAKHTVMDFSDYPYNDEHLGTCSKYRWANSCNVSWDGITYGVVNPCDE
jgi:hypothetical protein